MVVDLYFECHEPSTFRWPDVPLSEEERFPLKLNGTVYNSYVRPAILNGSEVCCDT